jgi:hypothetical protein
LALLLAAGVSSACQCPEGVSVADSFRDSDVVFLGRVERVISDGLVIRARLNVEESWKGVDTEAVTLRTSGTNCYLWPEVGQSYVVFGRRPPDGEYYNRACSPTARVSEAGEQLAYLRNEGTIPLKPSLPGYLEVGSATGFIVLLFMGVGLLWGKLVRRAALTTACTRPASTRLPCARLGRVEVACGRVMPGVRRRTRRS